MENVDVLKKEDEFNLQERLPGEVANQFRSQIEKLDIELEYYENEEDLIEDIDSKYTQTRKEKDKISVQFNRLLDDLTKENDLIKGK